MVITQIALRVNPVIMEAGFFLFSTFISKKYSIAYSLNKYLIGFLEEGPTTSAVSIGTAGSGRGSAAGCFNCYNPGGTDSPLVTRSHLQQKVNKIILFF